MLSQQKAMLHNNSLQSNLDYPDYPNPLGQLQKSKGQDKQKVQIPNSTVDHAKTTIIEQFDNSLD